jgi:ankyrin repeat protein
MRDNGQFTPLHYAASYEYLNIIEELISRKVDVKATNDRSFDAIAFFCMQKVF